MKKIKLIRVILIGIMVTQGLKAQDLVFGETYSTERKTGIDKDIEIAANILATLVQQETGLRVYGRIKGTYIQGYGIIFSLPKRHVSGTVLNLVNQPKAFQNGSVYVIDGQARSSQSNAPLKFATKLNIDSLHKEQGKSIIELAKTFLTDYGSLINGLKETERILITDQDMDFDRWRLPNLIETERERLFVEVKSSDLTLNKSGKLTKEQLLSRIKVSEGNYRKETAKDLELLSSIFNRLYQSDLSDSYYLSGNIYYEYLEGFGVMYQMRVYSSTGDAFSGLRGYRMATLGLDSLSKEERDKKVKELYPKFKDQLIKNIIQYGSTLNSLKPDQLVMFNVKLTECNGCELPESIEVSVKYSVLQKVRSGSLSAEKAVDEFNIVEKGSQ